MMKWALLLMVFNLPMVLFSQLIGARNEALGDSYLNHSDILSASSNISQLVQISHFSIGLTTQSIFTIKELQRSLLALGLPLKNGYIAINLNHYGYNKYQERSLGISYALLLSPSLSLGLKINLTQLSLRNDELGSAIAIYPDLGINYHFNSQLEISILIGNLTLAKVSQYHQQTWPIIADIGSKYGVNDKVSLFLETSMGLDQKAKIRSGIEYLIHPKLEIRIGAHSYPSSISFGFGLKLNFVSIDFSSSFNNTLGFTPSLSILYESKN